MDIDEAIDFIRDNHRAVMLTHRGDGSPQMSPVIAAVDDDGRVIVSTRETSMKVANLRRHPRASLCVFTERFFGPWTRVDGEVEIVELPEAMELLVDYYRRVQGEHDDWDEYREAMRDEQRVLVRLSVTEAGPDVSG